MESRPQLTDQQSKAIHTRGVSIALSAGAGCGKTFVLTQRFLAGLEPDRSKESQNDLHSLVAITFTERAAREMRDRIRAACHTRLQNCPVDQVNHWLGILRGLDAARISTIHSFCTGLLRSQAVEGGLDPRFTVLETPLSDALLRRVIRDSLLKLIETQDDDATQFVIDFGLERSMELLRRLTLQRFQIDFEAFLKLSPEELAAEWKRRWKTEVVPKLIADFRVSPLIERTQRVIAERLSTDEKMKDRFANLRSLLGLATNWTDNQQALEDVHENAYIRGAKKTEWVSEEAQETVRKLFEKLRPVVKDLKDLILLGDQDMTEATTLACCALRLTSRMANDYAAAKQAQSALDFDDLLLRARDLLRDNADVRKKIAAGIRLLMVDEFQDTDPVQADLVRNLCGTALSQGRLFMVGDRKQSIYRFRRADPTVFARMSDELPPSGRLPLNVNFRSQPAILNFVNHLFAPAMDSYEPLVPHRNEQFSPTPAIELLYASFDAVDLDPDQPARITRQHMLVEHEDDLRPNAAQLRAREADWIARRIRALLNDPTPRIRTKEFDEQGRPLLRPVKPGDIVILFRALSNVQAYETELQRYGLDYYLVGGKAFFAQQEVFDVLNLCRYLDDCDDVVALAGVLRSPFFNLNDDSLQALATQFDSGSQEPASDIRNTDEPESQPVPAAARGMLSLHQAIYLNPPGYLPTEQQDRIRFAAQILSELRTIKDRIPLANLLTQAVERTGYDASLLCEFLGSRKLANLRKLIEMARQFDQGQFFTLKDFVTRLQTSVLEETDEEFATTLPESGDVIRLMSIHQSKGLEFPVVIVADIDRKGPPKGGDAVLHPQLGALLRPPEQFGVRAQNLGIEMYRLAEDAADNEETVRLFYVACTRAADYLILSTGMDSEKPIHSPWFELIESRFDAQTGLLKVDPLLGSSTAGTAGRGEVPEIFVNHVPCDVKREDSAREKRVPLGSLPGTILEATAGELPESSREFPRDLTDVSTISVSRLEAIDEELAGWQHTSRRSKSAEFDEEELDLDMATALGKIIHSVLERADFHQPDHWPELLKKAVSQSPDNPTNETIEQANVMLDRFFESPIVAELANAKSTHREIDFLLPWASSHSSKRPNKPISQSSPILIAGIIDLLIETDKGWHVLDYKTGDFPQHTSDEQYLDPYELQLGVYAHAVEQWFGVVPRELSLIVFRPKVRRITLRWSASRWEQIRTRIDRVIDAVRHNKVQLQLF